MSGVALERGKASGVVSRKTKKATYVSEAQLAAQIQRFSGAGYFLHEDNMLGQVQADGTVLWWKDKAIDLMLHQRGFYFGKEGTGTVELYGDFIKELGREGVRYVTDVVLTEEPDDGGEVLRHRANWLYYEPYAVTSPEYARIMDAYGRMIELVGNHVPETSKFIEQCIVRILKHPHTNLGFSICLTGDGGTGKDSFFKLLEAMCGKWAKSCIGWTSLAEAHCMTLDHCVTLKVGEADDISKKSIRDRVLSYVTDKHVMLNPKFLPPRKSLTPTLIWSLTNKPDPIDRESLGTRRWCVLPMSVKAKNDTLFFQGWEEMLRDNRAVATLTKYFLQKDLDEGRLRDSIPRLFMESIAPLDGAKLVDHCKEFFFERLPPYNYQKASYWLCQFINYLSEEVHVDIPGDLMLSPRDARGLPPPAAYLHTDAQLFGTHVLAPLLVRGLIERNSTGLYRRREKPVMSPERVLRTAAAAPPVPRGFNAMQRAAATGTFGEFKPLALSLRVARAAPQLLAATAQIDGGPLTREELEAFTGDDDERPKRARSAELGRGAGAGAGTGAGAGAGAGAAGGDIWDAGPGRCCFCSINLDRYSGHNSAPVGDGQCCGICNATIVIPARLSDCTCGGEGAEGKCMCL